MENEFWSKFIEILLATALPPLVAWLVGMVYAYLRGLWMDMRGRMDAKAVFWIEEAARFAVLAAEQAGAAKLIEDKKKYALGIAEAFLLERGLKINLHLISAAIEKAVLETFPHTDGVGQLPDVGGE